MTPVILTPREYARLLAPDAAPKRIRATSRTDTPTVTQAVEGAKVQRPRRKRAYEQCAVCQADILDSESGYHVQINGCWEHYHRECFMRGRP